MNIIENLFFILKSIQGWSVCPNLEPKNAPLSS